MITIKEVAEKAGVSKATVSRVINHTGYVNDETRQKVEAVIRQYNYSPSASAVNLSRRETNTIGVVVPEIANSFFSELLYGITQVVDDGDFSLMYCDTDNNSMKEERAIRTLEQQRVRGVIITPARDGSSEPNAAKKLCEMLERLNVPVVVVDREFENSKWDGVFYENFQSAYCATSELIKAGSKKLGIITGDLNLKIARDRYNGFLQAASDYGLSVDPQYIYEGDFSTDTAYRLSKQMFESGDYPQAILTCNNQTNLGFIKAAREFRIELGRDIAAIGIDHVPVLDILDYNFSYVTRDTVEMGRVATRLLLVRMENPDAQRHICMIPYQLVLKGSEKMGD